MGAYRDGWKIPVFIRAWRGAVPRQNDVHWWLARRLPRSAPKVPSPPEIGEDVVTINTVSRPAASFEPAVTASPPTSLPSPQDEPPRHDHGFGQDAGITDVPTPADEDDEPSIRHRAARPNVISTNEA
jgi:hypothetical protein